MPCRCLKNRLGRYDGFRKVVPMARISCLLSSWASILPKVAGMFTALILVERPTEIIKSMLQIRKMDIPKTAIILLKI